MIFRSKPQVDGPFYSSAMQCWRIQYYQRGETYHYSRESSFYIERIADAERVAKLMQQSPVDSWEAWCKLVDAAKKLPEWEGFCWVTGIGAYGRETIRG